MDKLPRRSPREPKPQTPREVAGDVKASATCQGVLRDGTRCGQKETSSGGGLTGYRGKSLCPSCLAKARERATAAAAAAAVAAGAAAAGPVGSTPEAAEHAASAMEQAGQAGQAFSPFKYPQVPFPGWTPSPPRKGAACSPCSSGGAGGGAGMHDVCPGCDDKACPECNPEMSAFGFTASGGWGSPPGGSGGGGASSSSSSSSSAELRPGHRTWTYR